MDDDQTQVAATDAAPILTYEDLAGLMEHVLLRPELPETEVARGCEVAKHYRVAAVIVRPSDVDQAMHWVSGSSVVLGTVVEGHAATGVKTFAVRDMLRRGAREIDAAMNTGKLISRQFQYLEAELQQMADSCHQSGAVLKVILENQFLDQELKIVACRVCRRAGVDYIASSSPEDMPLLKEYSKERLKLKASGLIQTLEEALQLRAAGCTRMQSENTAAILDAWKASLEPEVVS